FSTHALLTTLLNACYLCRRDVLVTSYRGRPGWDIGAAPVVFVLCALFSSFRAQLLSLPDEHARQGKANVLLADDPVFDPRLDTRLECGDTLLDDVLGATGPGRHQDAILGGEPLGPQLPRIVEEVGGLARDRGPVAQALAVVAVLAAEDHDDVRLVEQFDDG